MVDDNPDGLLARRSVLEEQGYVITTKSDPHEALESFSTRRFDLVVTDYRMPGMTGLDLIRKIRALRSAVPIILLSSLTETMGFTESNTGADVVIQKSNNEETSLLRAVHRLLRKKPGRKPPGAEGGPERAEGAGG